MIASARSAYILRRLSEDGVIDYKSIAGELGVSEATARRDFEKLEKEGRLRRVQGGAVRIGAHTLGELSILAKNELHAEAKLKVAKAAAEIVQDGESIFLDCGSSIGPLAQFLLKRRIHIVTNNSLVLRSNPEEIRADVFVTGGRFHPADQMFTGPMTETMLASFTFHHAFIGCMGVDVEKDCVFVTDMECLALKKLAMSNAQRSILLADTSKETKRGLFRLAGYRDFDAVYINDDRSGRLYPDNFVVV